METPKAMQGSFQGIHNVFVKLKWSTKDICHDTQKVKNTKIHKKTLVLKKTCIVPDTFITYCIQNVSTVPLFSSFIVSMGV